MMKRKVAMIAAGIIASKICMNLILAPDTMFLLVGHFF